jgi:hypothetical protein
MSNADSVQILYHGAHLDKVGLSAAQVLQMSQPATHQPLFEDQLQRYQFVESIFE